MKSSIFKLVPILVLYLFVACNNTQTPVANDLQWEIEMGTGEYNQPVARVGLIYKSQKIHLMDQVDAPLEPLDKTKFLEKGVPTDAIIACTGFWAGYEQTLYVADKTDHYEVTLLTFEEGFPNPQTMLVSKIPK